MKIQTSNRHLCWCGLLALCLLAAQATFAQRRGGFGGFGGFSRGNLGSSSQQTTYSPNGTVGSATFSVDPDTGNLIVIGDKDTLESIGRVVESLDKPKPQVLIKVVFLEVQHNNALDLGVEGGFSKNINNSTVGAGANSFGLSGLNNASSNNVLNAFGLPIQGFNAIAPYSGLAGAGLYQVLGSDFQATLRAIAQAGKAQLLSRPSILARDRQPAEIVIGQYVPLITGVNYTTFGNQINSVTYRDVGIILEVTPYITANNLVQMIVSPQTSALDSTLSVPIAAGVNAPVIDVRSADTVVVTPDGQTVVIGGLMESNKASTESKIPLLGDIPLLGNLFKRKVNSNAKTELLIFLTPHIVRTPAQLAGMSEKEKARTLPPDTSFSEQELDRFLEHVPVKKQK